MLAVAEATTPPRYETDTATDTTKVACAENAEGKIEAVQVPTGLEIVKGVQVHVAMFATKMETVAPVGSQLGRPRTSRTTYTNETVLSVLYTVGVLRMRETAAAGKGMTATLRLPRSVLDSDDENELLLTACIVPENVRPSVMYFELKFIEGENPDSNKTDEEAVVVRMTDSGSKNGVNGGGGRGGRGGGGLGGPGLGGGGGLGLGGGGGLGLGGGGGLGFGGGGGK